MHAKTSEIFLQTLVWSLKFMLLFIINRIMMSLEANRQPNNNSLLTNLYLNGFILYFTCMFIIQLIEATTADMTSKFFSLAVLLLIFYLFI